MPRKSKENNQTMEETRPQTNEIMDRRASVFYKLGVTKSMGNMEFVRIDYGIELPCSPNEVRKITAKIVKEVEQTIDKELAKYATVNTPNIR